MALTKYHFKKLFSTIVLIITLVAVTLPTNALQSNASTQNLTTKRLAGDSRTLTAVEISKEG